jgi:hypothetical protein
MRGSVCLERETQHTASWTPACWVVGKTVERYRGEKMRQERRWLYVGGDLVDLVPLASDEVKG